MAGKHVVGLFGIAFAILLVFSLSDRLASATTFNPTLRASLENANPGANSTVTIELDIAEPDANFAKAEVFAMGPEWDYVGMDADVPDGTLVGHVTLDSRFGLLNGACSTPLLLDVELMDSTTFALPGAGMDWDDDLSGNNLIEDNVGAGCTGGPDGLPDYVDCYPSFLNDMIRPDPPGGVPPVLARARLSGHITVVELFPSILLSLLLYDPGDLSALPEPESSMGASLGYPAVVVLGNPVGGRLPSGITDFCTPLTITADIFGVSRGVVEIVPGTTPFERLWQCSNGVDDNGDTEVDDGCIVLEDCGAAPEYSGNGSDETPNNNYGADAGCGTAMLTNPAPGTGIYGGDTHLVRVYSQSLRDYDYDGIENDLDPCAVTVDPGWDPRAASNPATDPDNDGLPNSCDPDPSTPSPSANVDCWVSAGLPDEDQDCLPNRSDNCPLVKNGWENGAECDEDEVTADDDDGDGTINDGCPEEGSGSETGAQCTNNADDDGDTFVNDGCPGVAAQTDNDEPVDAPSHDIGPYSDGIGDACEPDWDGDTVSDPEEAGLSPTVADGHYHHSHPIAAVCIGNIDSDGDGWCDADEDLLGSDKNNAQSTPEYIGIDYAIPADGVLGPAPQTCDDGVDNDGDTLTDSADPGCAPIAGDMDDDGVQDAWDNCPEDKNPEQADWDGDTVGDECDFPAIDHDGDGFRDTIEQYVGTDPWDDCPDDLSDDAWPLDMDNDQQVGTDDVLAYAGKVAPPTTVPPSNVRLDLDADGDIDTSDVLMYAGLVAPPIYCT